MREDVWTWVAGWQYLPNHEMKKLDITGNKFGRLTATRFSHVANKKTYWLFKCDCGNEKAMQSFKVIHGLRKSCGCKTSEILSEKHRTHGETVGYSPSKEYSLWVAMKNRCSHKSRQRADYMDRGIKVCERWDNSFEAFLEDLGRRPSPAHSIHRVDNDGHYEPENVRWATAKEQAKYRRSNVWVSIEGKRMILVEAATLLGVGVGKISSSRTKAKKNGESSMIIHGRTVNFIN